MTTNNPLGDLTPHHELTFVSADPWTALGAFAALMSDEGAALVGLTLSGSPGGASLIRARLSGIGEDAARNAADRLMDVPGVDGARLEHVIWKARA